MDERFGPGHFRLGRLNEAAGVCGGRGTYGYSIEVEVSGTDDLRRRSVLKAFVGCPIEVMNGDGWLDWVSFSPNGAPLQWRGHT